MKTLIIIDMQEDFTRGALFNQSAIDIIPSIVEKIKNHNGPIILTRDTHYENYLNTPEGKLLPVPHCIEGTSGHEIVKEILDVIPDNAIILNKPTFGYNGWDTINTKEFEILKNSDEIELVGTCTDICVVSNALILKSKFPEPNYIVDSNCCAGLTPEKHEAALEVMRSCQITVL